MKRFDLIVVPFPFTDRDTFKRRPALVLSNASYNKETGQVICAMITKGARSAWRSDVDINKWTAAGLPVPSKVRLKVFTLDRRLILKRLGQLEPSDAKNVEESLKQAFLDK